jgi:hypothetical protein
VRVVSCPEYRDEELAVTRSLDKDPIMGISSPQWAKIQAINAAARILSRPQPRSGIYRAGVGQPKKLY